MNRSPQFSAPMILLALAVALLMWRCSK